MIGPVQENETSESVKAMKKMPIKPPRSEAASALLIKALGKVISKAPKNETAKMTKMIKKAMLKIPLLARSFSASGPRVMVTINPSKT